MPSPIDRMIMSSVKCTLCGASYGQCDCWQKCSKCGWSFQTGEKCRNRACGGSGTLEVIASASPKKRRNPART